MRFLTFLMLFCLAKRAKADLPGPAYQYDLYSQNKAFYFKSIPFYDYDRTDLGKTTVYNARTGKAIYKIDHYLPRASFISSDGQTLITTAHWVGGHAGFEDQDIITVYINGKEAKKYYIHTLAAERLTIEHTTSHSLWYEDLFLQNDTLYVLTLDEEVILLDAKTGSVLSTQEKSFVTKRFDLNKLPQLKTVVYYNIKYPNKYGFPRLYSGSDFRTALINDLGKEEVSSYDSSSYTISIGCLIDRGGKGEIFYLEASTDREEKDNPELKKRVEDWILRQRFKTGQIPKNCDKWVFEEVFYLK